MKIDDLVALLDSYTASGGYYIKPRTDGGQSSFFMAKGSAAAADVRRSFDAADGAFGQRADKPACTFSSEVPVECAICCNVPNLPDTDNA